MSAAVAAVVLAAGRGTRFRSQTAKVLHRAAGRSLLGHVLAAVEPLGLAGTVVVVGHQADEVAAEARSSGLDALSTVVQTEQRGTGHAVQVALGALGDDVEQVLVLPGDTPLLTSATLAELLAAGAGAAGGSGAAGALLTAVLDDAHGYGRVVRGPDGQVLAVVEQRDASAEQLEIGEINAGMYLLDRAALERAVGRLRPDNAQGELYLTDVVADLAGSGRPLRAVVTDIAEVAGVNDRAQLADAAAVLRRRHLDHLLREVGVTITDPATTYLDVDVEVGRDSVIAPGVVLEAGTRIGEQVTIGPGCHLTGCVVGDGASVHSTRAVEAEIGPGASVGPFTHLRPGTRLGAATKVGAFVETKNLALGEGSKVPHLAYLGDATVGERVNVACGVITVNYDGAAKHHTTIDDGAFVGCDTMLVAPVTIGAGGYTAAGSTITEDVPPGALAIARARQTTKDGWAERRRGAS